jgi:hypothetical protein
MADILKKLKALRSELSKGKSVEKPLVFWNKKLSDAQLGKIQDSLSFEIPQDILKVYAQINGLVIDWEKRQADEPWRTTYGMCNIPRLDFLFRHDQITVSIKGKSRLDSYWPDGSTEDQVSNFKQFYVVDYLKTGEFILVQPHENKTHSQLYLFVSPNTFRKLTLDFETYIFRLIDVQAEYGWQYAFLEEPLQTSAGLSLQPPETATNYYNRLQEQVALLKSSPHLKKIKFEPNPGVRLSTLKRIKNQVGLELPDEIMAFYYYLNGFKLSWKWSDGSMELEGGVDLLPLENVFGGRGGSLSKSWGGNFVKAFKWLDEDQNDAVLKSQSLANYRLESVEGVSKEVGIQFDLDDSQQPANLFLLDKGDARILPVTFQVYIDRLIATLGLNNWHETLIRPDPDFAARLSALFLKS